MSKYLAFDIEIAKEIPEGETDWKQHRPLGITCAAATSSDGGRWLWYGQNIDGSIAAMMSRDKVKEIINTLLDLATGGYTILTWNGLGFDFDVLAEESGLSEKCKLLALHHHIDMMFQFFCDKGYPLGLEAASKGMGLPGKPEGMDGAKAPELWPTDPLKVMRYCMSDCENTLALAQAVENAGRLDWTSRSGRPNSWQCSEWLTVRSAMELPEPDTSWMSNPWPREKFYDWTEKGPKRKISKEELDMLDSEPLWEGQDATAVKL